MISYILQQSDFLLIIVRGSTFVLLLEIPFLFFVSHVVKGFLLHVRNQPFFTLKPYFMSSKYKYQIWLLNSKLFGNLHRTGKVNLPNY